MDTQLETFVSEPTCENECDTSFGECSAQKTTGQEINYGEQNSFTCEEHEKDDSFCTDEEDLCTDPEPYEEGSWAACQESEGDCKEDVDISREEEPCVHQGSEDISDKEAVRVLKRELELLREQLDRRERAYERMMGECAEFSELYPDTALRTLPDAVWDRVRDGVPIAAAYALYEKKRAVEACRAAQSNEKNSAASAGGVGAAPDDLYFSPSEVRRMSQGEVKKNYTKILESMRRWG